MEELKKMDNMVVPSGKEEKGSGKIESIIIKVLDDGTYLYTAITDKHKEKEYSYQHVKDLEDALEDDLKSPHLRKGKKYGGNPADSFKNEIKRKKPNGYEKSKFQKLIAEVKKK